MATNREGFIRQAAAEFQSEPAIRSIPEVRSIRDFANQKIAWAVDGAIPEGAVTMLSGEPSGGKTTIALAIAACVFNGTPFAGRATWRRPVLILDRENPLPAIVERFDRLGARDGPGFHYWGTWQPEEAPAPGGAIVQEWVLNCAPRPLIVVDSLISFLEGDENSANEARNFMQQLRALANMGATVIVLHHSGKGETAQEYRGSSDFKASIDVGYVVANIGPDPAVLERVRLRNFKARFQVSGELVLKFDGLEFVPEEAKADPLQTNEALLGELLRQNPGVTVRDFQSLAAARSLGRDRARNFLKAGIQRGLIGVTKGDCNARLHTWGEQPGGLLQ